MIEIKEITKVFQAEDVQTMALNKVNLEVSKGEFVAIMGPSGCGKSTLLNIIGMLESPTSGNYEFLDHQIFSLPEKKRTELRKKHIGFVFQNFNLIDELNIFENVELPLLYLGVPAPERKLNVTEVLEKLEMAHRKKYFPMQLSGGQQQRIAVARALVVNPSLLLADEPTGNLDSHHGDDVMNLFINLNDAGTTIVMVTHSARDAEYSTRIVNLFDGQIVSEKY
ncbi:MAG: ABC transporter ATP-binding protein [Bacteroidales bacterium]|nr:ABC transporter ATP-binding protein [Bacteroidota bacterium]MBL6950075.1 ABC transporter ATP-binding protein [Bacteroidales bacterium]